MKSGVALEIMCYPFLVCHSSLKERENQHSHQHQRKIKEYYIHMDEVLVPSS
jgi:hypothetical protein